MELLRRWFEHPLTPCGELSITQISLKPAFLSSNIGRSIHVRILGGMGDAHTTQNPYQWKTIQILANWGTAGSIV